MRDWTTPEAATGRFPLEGGELDEGPSLRTVPRLRAPVASWPLAALAARQSRFRGACLVTLVIALPTGVLASNDDVIPQPLTATLGDPARGRALVASRQQGLCLLCHQAPIPEERFQGNLATNLAGAGSRWSAAQLRLRIVDSRRLNADSIMPAFHRSEGLRNVGQAWAGKTVFDAQQVEDVVAYLVTLKD